MFKFFQKIFWRSNVQMEPLRTHPKKCEPINELAATIQKERNWSALEHAYGQADDIPNILAEVLGTDSEKAAGAIEDLNFTIYHQGTVYSASAPCVPYLVAALKSSSATNKVSLLLLLASLAEGHGYYEEHRSLSLVRDYMGEWEAGKESRIIEEERSNVKNTSAHVTQHWDEIALQLKSTDYHVKATTLFCLTELVRLKLQKYSDEAEGLNPAYAEAYPPGVTLTELKRRLVDLIQDTLNHETSDLIKANCLAALSTIHIDDHSGYLSEFDEDQPISSFVSTLVAIRDTLARSNEPPLELETQIRKLLENSTIIHLKTKSVQISASEWECPWLWDNFDIRWQLLDLLSEFSAGAINRIGKDIAAAIISGPELFSGASDSILKMIFSGGMPPSFDQGICNLDAGQRAIAEAITSAPMPEPTSGFWYWDTNWKNRCKELGAPSDVEQWKRWLNGGPS